MWVVLLCWPPSWVSPAAAWRNARQPARAFALGWRVCLAVSATHALYLWGWLPIDGLAINDLEIGAAAAVLLSSIGANWAAPAMARGWATTLLVVADAALYRAKSERKNRVSRVRACLVLDRNQAAPQA